MTGSAAPPGRVAVLEQLDVSRETEARLDAYAALLKKWNRSINLVADSTLESVWERHFLDSAQLLAHCPAGVQKWADLGSGAGFPGMVIAILAAEKRPEIGVTLVESDKRKAAFLAAVTKAADLKVALTDQRAESLPPLRADIVSARALAALEKLLEYCERHLVPSGRALFLKGARHEAEIAAALENWRFSVQKFPSKTDPEAVILEIEGVSRV